VYPGAGPAEVETQITKRVEDAVSSIGNIKSLESISRENLSLVLIEFDLGVDVDLAAIDVKDKVEAVRAKFPRDAEAPVVVKFDINAMPIIDLAVSSPRPLEEVYRTTKDVIKDYISRVEGVANVNIIGGKKREIQVNVDKRLMRAYGLSLAQVVGAVAAENLNLPTGRITEKRKEYSLRLLGEFRSLQELARIRIPAGENASVYLSDIAQVVDGFADQRDLARFNGKPTVGVEIQKRSGANTVKVSEGVYHALAELEQILPADYEVTVAHDRSRFIRDAVTDVTKNIFIGILLTTVLLYLFLHSFKITLVAAIAMPTSVVASFLLIDFAHFTLNIMTLMALGITVGVLVTNSIVVLENIIRHLRMGKDPARAAVDGTSEVTIAVVASTLTNVVVFTPIAFMSGIVGRFFYQFGLTVVFATIFSLVVSFTLTPLLASRFLGGGAGRREREGALGWFESAWNRFYGTLEELYRRALARALARKTQVLAFTFLAFVVAFFLLSQVGAEFMPTLDEGFVRIELEMPPGTSLEETDRVLREVEGILARLPETVSVLSSIGGPEQGVEDATVILRIVDKSERDRGIVDFANDLKPLLAAIPDADVRIKVSSER
ncbi:MAG: efflux RND transporter permease subunit, partial [Candidatus Bipolaricaulia bacterium]